MKNQNFGLINNKMIN